MTTHVSYIRKTVHVVSRPSGFPYEKVRERTLYLQVLDYDRFSRNDPIGEVSIPLNKVELGQLKTFWKDLKPCSDGSVSLDFTFHQFFWKAETKRHTYAEIKPAVLY